ncbi:MAG: protein kinase [Ruminococcus sp.]|nr:protein kinase [Ruminococcus sp.]
MTDSQEIINGTYRIICPIGKGGTGIIYLAEHLHLRKKVVLKKIKASLIDSPAVRQEADILKSLHHMYLPQVYDFLEYENQIFTVIDYIDGCDLQQYIDQNILLDEETLVKWMIELCDALDYLHSHNPPVYHNDIKPANIIVNSEGDICLIDFNISTDAADVVYGFTKEYASPEQYYLACSVLNGEYEYLPTVTGRSDLYSMGASFYSIASRQQVSVYSVINGMQPKLSQLATGYSEGFCEIIDRLMNTSAEYRFQSATELKKALISLKKQDSRYKSYVCLRVCSWILTGLIAVSGILMIYHGKTSLTIEGLDESYSLLCEAYDTQNYSDTIELGSDILADDDWSSIADDDKNANVNYMIGMSYYYSENYVAAEEYLMRAIELESNSELRCNYEMDLAILYAYMDRFSEASDMLAHSESDGLNASRVNLVNAQISYSQGNYSKAIDLYDITISDGQSEFSQDTYNRFCELAADSYKALNDYNSAIALYEQIYSGTSGTIVGRKLASSYIRQANTKTIVHEITEYLEKAAAIYNSIISEGNYSVEDYVNLGKVYRICGDKVSDSYYEQSISVLESAAEKYPNDYRVYVQLAISSDRSGNTQSAVYYCNLADEKLSESQQSELTDAEKSDMALFNDLKSKLEI